MPKSKYLKLEITNSTCINLMNCFAILRVVLWIACHTFGITKKHNRVNSKNPGSSPNAKIFIFWYQTVVGGEGALFYDQGMPQVSVDSLHRYLNHFHFYISFLPV